MSSTLLEPPETETRLVKPARDEVVGGGLYHWSLEQFQEIVRRGILTSEDRVELLKGVVVKKMTNNPKHAEVIEQLTERLRILSPEGWRLRVQLPIQSGDNQPEPDFSITRKDRVRGCHPSGGDVLLVIEIADSSLSIDRKKAAIYAQAGIPHYWIINLPENQVEVYGVFNPATGEYTSIQIRREGESIEFHSPQGRVDSLLVSDLLSST